MFISPNHTRRAVRSALGYTLAAAGTAVFGAVYECFSHEVYSPFMLYAFLVPLLLGAVPYLIAAKRCVRMPPRRAAEAYSGAVLLLTLGSVMKGVLDIYGTTNRLLLLYPVCALALLLLAAALFAAGRRKTKNPA